MFTMLNASASLSAEQLGARKRCCDPDVLPGLELNCTGPKLQGLPCTGLLSSLFSSDFCKFWGRQESDLDLGHTYDLRRTSNGCFIDCRSPRHPLIKRASSMKMHVLSPQKHLSTKLMEHCGHWAFVVREA